MSSSASRRSQLAAFGIRPKKSLGQNFLIDPVHLARIAAAADLGPTDTVLEIGPGLGALTELLAAQAGRVIAVELDDRLIPYLRAGFAARPHVTIVHGDILELAPEELVRDALRLERPGPPDQRAGPEVREPAPAVPYKVVANLPYYITSAAIRHLLEAKLPPELLVLTVQREVAERMVASPPKMSLLALGVQFYCTAQIVARIPAGAFRPVPKVDSAVVRLVRRSGPVVPGVAAEEYFRIARAGFSRPRKQLRNSLAGGMRVPPSQAEAWLEAAGIDPRRRAETLALKEWGRLASIIDAWSGEP